MDSIQEVKTITTKKKIRKKPRSASCKGTPRSPSGREKTAAQKTLVKVQHRTCTGTRTREQEPTVVLHLPVDVTEAKPYPGRTRSNPIVYEAMELLRKYGYNPARVSEPSLPINLIGMKESGSLLILVLRSRLPVPNAATLRELYTGKVDYLRGLAGRVMGRIMIWVYSPACGWRYYLVYPGGLRYDLDFPKSIQ